MVLLFSEATLLNSPLCHVYVCFQEVEADYCLNKRTLIAPMVFKSVKLASAKMANLS